MRILASLALLLAASGIAPASHTDVVEGNPASPVKVLIYEDLQSGQCALFRRVFDQMIVPRYGRKVAFIHRDLPLGRDDWAVPAAIAARWVFEQSNDLGLIVRREMLAEQDNINSRNLKQWLVDFAYRNHLDPKSIVDSLSDKRLAALVDQDRQAAVARGVSKVPAVYVGGVPFVETIIYDDLARALDDALAK